ncbi:hypothetical protein BGZ94_006393 [Podila epigama]|nr:hypothetical protein BGZ94_006393 [Podila epigama]
MPSTISTAVRLWQTILAPTLTQQWPRIVVALYCIRDLYILLPAFKKNPFDTDIQSIAQDGKNDTAFSELENTFSQQELQEFIFFFQIVIPTTLGLYDFVGLYGAVRKSILASKINLLFWCFIMMIAVFNSACVLLYVIGIKTGAIVSRDFPQGIDPYFPFKWCLELLPYGWASFVMLRDYRGYRNRNVFGFMRRQTAPEAIAIEKKSLLL